MLGTLGPRGNTRSVQKEMVVALALRAQGETFSLQVRVYFGQEQKHRPTMPVALKKQCHMYGLRFRHQG